MPVVPLTANLQKLWNFKWNRPRFNYIPCTGNTLFSVNIIPEFFVCTWRHNLTWAQSWLTLICWCVFELIIMTNVLSIFVKCVGVKFVCCCARVLQCQPRWRPIANHLYFVTEIDQFNIYMCFVPNFHDIRSWMSIDKMLRK